MYLFHLVNFINSTIRGVEKTQTINCTHYTKMQICRRIKLINRAGVTSSSAYLASLLMRCAIVFVAGSDDDCTTIFRHVDGTTAVSSKRMFVNTKDVLIIMINYVIGFQFGKEGTCRQGYIFCILQ